MMGDREPVTLHHVEDGRPDGPPLLLLGSLGSTLEMWRPQLPALTPNWRVIRVDHRGHGESPVPAGPYTVADLAGDALALMDRLELERVSFLGLSLGGMVGMYLASEEPRRIDRLVLCATTARFGEPSPWPERIATVAAGGTESIAEATATRWFTPAYAAAHPDKAAWAEAMVRDTPDAGYLACCQALRDWDHVHRLGAIQAPTLMIAGAADPSTPKDPHADVIAAGIPDARLEVLDAAHLLTIERADEANKLITEHLGN
nr:3-oxoadipate enol-lactonase [Pseudonocardia acaciae]